VRILVDMSVDIRVADWLRSQGHDAVHLRDERLHRMPNGEIFAKALSEDRIVVTSDLDFGEIAAALKDTAGKVVLLRLQTVGPQTSSVAWTASCHASSWISPPAPWSS